MTELEKCMAGELYNCHDEIFLQYKKQAKELLDIYNRLTYDQKEEKKGILHKLFGGIGTNVSVGAPFLCDYGCNIITGSNVSINMNCSFIDCNQIKIGNNVMIASNVQIYTGNASRGTGRTPDARLDPGERKAFLPGICAAG